MFPDPFYQLNQMRNSPHPFHTQNTQKVALETTRSQAARAVAWLLPKPENASIFQRPKPSERLEELLLPSATRALVTTPWESHANGIRLFTEMVQLALGENCKLEHLIRIASTQSQIHFF